MHVNVGRDAYAKRQNSFMDKFMLCSAMHRHSETHTVTLPIERVLLVSNNSAMSHKKWSFVKVMRLGE